MKNVFLIFFILLDLILASGIGYLVYQDNKYIPPPTSNIKALTDSILIPDKFIAEPKLKDIAATTPRQIKLSGWIPTWAMDSGVKSLEENKQRFESVSPVFYIIQPDGSVNSDTSGLAKIKASIQGSQVKIIPTISSFDPQGLSINLNNPVKLNSFLLSEVDEKGYDGLDLNYESTYLKDKQAFFNHLQFLSSELHKRNKVFYVTVLSKWGDNIDYGFAPQTRAVQNYAEIAKYADRIRIMAYDFTSQGSTTPGPIAPIDWIDRVLDYATSRVNPSKLSLGIHLYGYFWSDGSQAIALNYREISQIKTLSANSDAFYSEKNQEAVLKYIGPNGKTFFGYYASPESVNKKLELAAEYGLSSVSFWRLGDDPI